MIGPEVKATVSLDDVLTRAAAVAIEAVGQGATVGPEHVLAPLLGKASADFLETVDELTGSSPAELLGRVQADLDRTPTVEVGVELPMDGDLLFCSVFGGAALGASARAVLTAAGWNPDDIQPVEPTVGFSFLGGIGAEQEDSGGQRPVMIIASHARRQRAPKALPENLTKAVRYLSSLPEGAALWLPLMGSGAGGLSPLQSLRITVAALRIGGLFDKMTGGKITFSLGADQAGALPELQAYLKETFPTYRERESEKTAAQQRALMAQELRNDQPSGVDHFGHTPLIDALEAFITAEGTKPPLVIGIDAPWGAGKSSVMKMLGEKLREGPRQPTDEKDARPPTWKEASKQIRVA